MHVDEALRTWFEVQMLGAWLQRNRSGEVSRGGNTARAERLQDSQGFPEYTQRSNGLVMYMAS